MKFERNIDDKWQAVYMPENMTEEERILGKQCRFLTFRGALDAVFERFTKNIKTQDTVTQYDRMFSKTIFPCMEDHNRTWINQYALEDFENLVERIRQRGKLNKGLPYAEQTIQQFKGRIYYVIKYASEAGLCDHVLWGSNFSIEQETVRDYINENIRLRKSLSVKEEYLINNEIFGDPSETGAKVGLLLMWALGLRNAEACGLNYEHIQSLQEHPNCKVFYIIQTTKPGSSQIQSSGKTANADRILPIPDKLYQFLVERKQSLTQMQGDGVVQDINQLPICCKCDIKRENIDKFGIRCSAADLTREGRKLFKKIGMKEDQLKYIDFELSTNDELVEEIKEKDPSAYLFRRNFATHLQILGVSEPDIQYLIGHDIESPYHNRNEYVNDDLLEKLSKKLSFRPIFNQRMALIKTDLDPNREVLVLDGSIDEQIHVKYLDPNNETIVKLRVESREPEEKLKVKFQGNNSKYLITTIVPKPFVSDNRSINIIKDYHHLYDLYKPEDNDHDNDTGESVKDEELLFSEFDDDGLLSFEFDE